MKNTYPKNPQNEHVSKWPDGFSGCLVCGSTIHWYTTCPNKSNGEAINLFRRNFGHIFPSPERGRTNLFLIFSAN